MVSRCGLALRLPGTDAGRLFMCLWAISVCLLGRNVCRVLCPFFNQGGYVAPELQELWALWDPPVSSAGAVGTLGSPRVGHRSRGHSGIPLCRARELWALWPPPPVLDAGAVGTLGPTTVLGAGAVGTLGPPPPVSGTAFAGVFFRSAGCLFTFFDCVPRCTKVLNLDETQFLYFFFPLTVLLVSHL